MRTKEQNPIDEPKVKDPEVNDYETEGHLRTLMDAHKIMSDSSKMSKVHALAGRHKKALNGISKIKDNYPDPVEPDADDKGIKKISDLNKALNDKFGSKAISKLGKNAAKK